MGTNMLSCKKVKLHGLKDSRWTVHDHLTQYKGLVNLYTRDKKFVDADAKLNIKKQKKEYKQLTRNIALSRQELKDSMHGDQQRVRNILAEDRGMKLAYQNLHVTKVIDHVYQDNFACRKMLDLQNYRLKLKIDDLIRLRLEAGDLEMQKEFQSHNKTPLEVQIAMVTGKVQDMILKKEAAITVKTTYTTLVKIMKKDLIYYDAVLETLKEDALAQGECLIQSTTLGQLATEYVDDRRNEFETLQACVKEDTKIRIHDLTNVRSEIEETVKKFRDLIRRDSDLTTCIDSHMPTTASWMHLQAEINENSRLLNLLKDATMVSNFDAIFPCMEEQARQETRLTEIVAQNEEARNRLRHMRNHASALAILLENTMVESTEAYKKQKTELLQRIFDEEERKMDASIRCEKRGKLLVKIRQVLQHLQHITHKVQTQASSACRSQTERISEESVRLPSLEVDGPRLITIIRAKVAVMLTKFFESEKDMNEVMMLEAEDLYAQLINKKCKKISTDARIAEADLLEELIFEDPLIPTREFIKSESEQIVLKMHQMEIMMV